MVLKKDRELQYMDESFIRNRITELRMQNGVSEYKMSLDMGHSKSYIQSISSGKALPSLSEFLYICEYLHVTPKEFFDTGDNFPQLTHTLYEITRKLPADDIKMLTQLAERMSMYSEKLNDNKKKY